MWDNEEEFVESFAGALPASDLWLRRQGHRTLLLPEVEGMHGRVDLMMASVPTQAILLRDEGRLMANRSCAKLVVALRAKQPKTLDQLARDTGLSRSSVQTWISKMVRVGLVERIASGGYIASSRLDLPRVEIWSFEAKLFKWPRALYQASRYRSFSHRSLVVMPEASVGPAARARERFRRARVGLLGLTEDLRVRVHVMPRARKPRSQHLHALATAQLVGGPV